MAATPTTKAQVHAYRFVLRRMEHALVRGDAVMLHDPMRTQVRAIAVGVVLAVLGLAGVALLSLFRPADDVGGDVVLLDRQTLQAYVVLDTDGTRVLHPVLNLASARLVAGRAAEPRIVDGRALAELPRGQTLGIPLAPNDLPGPDDRPAAVWTVCDAVLPSTSAAGVATVSTTVIAGTPAGASGPLGPTQALHVAAPDGTTQLLQDGRRAVLDPSDVAVVRALGLSDSRPRPVSAGLLNSVPQVPDLAVPVVPGAGEVGAGGLPVGQVVTVPAPGGPRSYLVLRAGVQELGEVAAALMSAGAPSTELDSDALAGVPDVDPAAGVDFSSFPATVPQVVDAATAPVGCLSWDGTGAQPSTGPAAAFVATRTLLAGATLPLADGARPVRLAGADDGAGTDGADSPGGAGFALDAVHLPPGAAAVVQPVSDGQPAGVGTRYLVSETGTRYGIDTVEVARVLGLGDLAAPAPAAVLALLPQGPALDVRAAYTAHDGAPSGG